MDLSIIVTVHNKEEYLSRCLDSVFGQQFTGAYEVIAVDDASTDKSHVILEEYARREPGFRVIYLEENMKQAFARATGMESACGDYIMHMDSDDWLLPGAFERIHARLRETNADVLTFNFIRAYADGTSLHPRPIKSDLVTREKLEVIPFFMGGAVTRVVRRELSLKMIAQEADIVTTEDLLYCIEVLLKSQTICLIPDEFYAYFVNRKSVSWTTPPRIYLQNQVVVLKMLDRIFAEYPRDPRLVREVLNFLEKWIFYVIAQAHIVNGEKHEIEEALVEAFGLYPEFSRKDIRSIKLAFRSNLWCLLQVKRSAGLRTAASIVYRGLRGRLTA